MKMTVWVGGGLPESKLPKLLEVLRDDNVKLIDGYNPDLDSPQQLLDFNTPNSIEFEFEPDIDMRTWAMSVDLSLDDFCRDNNLAFKKRIPPCVGPDDEHWNEALSYWAPGMQNIDIIPTDGEGEITVRQNDTLELFDQLWALHKSLTIDDCPLHINDQNHVTATYAKNVMAGKPFDEIFKELLKSQVGHEEIEIPPFKIIKGK
jgi:hypothetical protein